MGHKRFKCACGMTTSLTGKDAEKVMVKATTKANYKPTGTKKKTK
tara:strand:+ start:1358 stop:1492 length:135 start_codon:yes stop_codon:yes gene_type:complete